MKINNGIPVIGKVHIALYDENGKLKEEQNIHNLVVALGCAYIADKISDDAETAMSHMAVGDDSTPTNCSQTALISELARVALDSTTQGAGANDNDVVYVATFGAGTGTGALTEAGIFNDVSAGTMFSRATFSVVNKAAADTLVITWTVTIGSC